MRAALAAMATGLLVLALVATASAAPRRVGADPGVFAGLGTWVDIYDGTTISRPEQVADRLAARGVRTVYIETANYKASLDVVNAPLVGRLVDRLHVLGLKTVAWYLPGFRQPALDLRRTRAMLSFRTPAGGAFDGVALDIEALVVKNTRVRTERMLTLLQTLRAAAATVPVAAITYPHRMLERHPSWWPAFPWGEIAASVDAFIPMMYTGGAFPGYDMGYGYITRSLRLLRAAVGPDAAIHVAGGIPTRMTPDELKAFTDAVADDGTAIGWSLYDLATTTPAGWSAITTLGR